MPKQALLSRVAALPETFLAEIPTAARERLLCDAPIVDIRAGDLVFSARDIDDRAGVVLSGVARTCLQSHDGRQLSIRYAHAGIMVGSITAPRSAVSVQAVTDCTIVEINRRRLGEVLAADGTVGLALIAEITRRLVDTYATLAANTFGTMRERVARQLLDMATETTAGQLVVPVTQQTLADAVGTVREVVARILREFRDEDLVATSAGHIELLDPDGLAAIVARWRSG